MGAGHTHPLYVHEHSAAHRLEPAPKLVAVLVFVAAMAITDPRSVWAFAVYTLIAAAGVVIARIPSGFFLTRLMVILPFVLFALFIPFVASGDRIDFFGIRLSEPGLWAAWGIIAKAGLGATASIVLVATTDIPDILRGLNTLRVPPVLVSIAGLLVRYLELIAGEMARMRVAMMARAHDPRWLWQARPIAQASGALFVRSYERGERVHAAMLSRGFTGIMPVTEFGTASLREWVAAMTLPALAVIVSVAVIVS